MCKFSIQTSPPGRAFGTLVPEHLKQAFSPCGEEERTHLGARGLSGVAHAHTAVQEEVVVAASEQGERGGETAREGRPALFHSYQATVAWTPGGKAQRKLVLDWKDATAAGDCQNDRKAGPTSFLHRHAHMQGSAQGQYDEARRVGISVVAIAVERHGSSGLGAGPHHSSLHAPADSGLMAISRLVSASREYTQENGKLCGVEKDPFPPVKRNVELDGSGSDAMQDPMTPELKTHSYSATNCYFDHFWGGGVWVWPYPQLGPTAPLPGQNLKPHRAVALLVHGAV
ncbi:hypothetical protein JZ751_029552 [Albula glossodonta]|uniref:Uncharacterized protein n=1 Tax=Albula glossodonta TaxID=121402 RepID=A0A8T2NLK2_9TELE|nr:hypothetical protein JZ751_029552 [Albula glossodonta]